MKFLKKNGITILLVIFAVVGLALIAYPPFANWWNGLHQSRAVASYAEMVANMDAEAYEKAFERADLYNAEIAKSGIRWKMTKAQERTYEDYLDVTGTGIMGYIEIPKAGVRLPIYHGTDEAVLQIATGHIDGSSLPVGGESTHAIISGHRGLPSSDLFTHIDRLVAGDTWTITILNRLLTYEVEDVQVVLPDDLSSLVIEPGRDLCTLVTCTPLGVNTHRLLIRGHRIENIQGEASVNPDASEKNPGYMTPFITAPVLLAAILTVFPYGRPGGRVKRKKKKAA